MSDDFANNDPTLMETPRHEAAVRGLLGRYPEPLTKRAMEDVARARGLRRTTLYPLIRC